MERERFLSRVATAVMASSLPPSPVVPAELPELEPVDLISLFRERAILVDSVVHGPVTRHGVPRVVTGIASGHDCKSFVAWDHLLVPGIAAALAANGLTHVDHEISPTDGREEQMVAYGDVSLGVTGSIAGLAESGSVVLDHHQGQPRLASLVPETHVVLLEVSSIATTLAHWAARHPDLAARSPNLVIISGPSRTGDIEQILNLGVHGPRHLHVVLIK